MQENALKVKLIEWKRWHFQRMSYV